MTRLSSLRGIANKAVFREISEAMKPSAWWHWAILLIFGLCMLIHLITRLFGKTADFAVFWWAGRLLLKGRDIYETVQGLMPYPYPPFFAILMVPFSLFPQKISYFLWQLGQIVALTWSYLALEKTLYGRSNNNRFWLTLLLWSPTVIDNWRVGQCNHLQLACLVAMITCLIRKKQKEAGITLGMAMLIKPFFLVPILLWFAIKRLWLSLIICIITLIVGIWLIPALIWGMSKTNSLLFKWYEVASTVSSEELMTYRDKSLTSTIYRLLTPVNVSHTSQPIFVNLLSLSPQTAAILTFLITSLLAIVVFHHCYRYKSKVERHDFIWQSSLIITLTMLLFPLVDRHHCIFMLPAFLLLSDFIINCKQCDSKSVVIALATIGWILYGLVSLLPRTWILHPQYWAHSAGLLLFLTAILKVMKETNSALIGGED